MKQNTLPVIISVIIIVVFMESAPVERLSVPRDRSDGDAVLRNSDALWLRLAAVGTPLRHREICQVEKGTYYDSSMFFHLPRFKNKCKLFLTTFTLKTTKLEQILLTHSTFFTSPCGVATAVSRLPDQLAMHSADDDR